MYIIREQSRERARESDTVKTKEHMCAAEISNHCSVGFVFVQTTSHHSKIHVPNVFYSVMFDTLAYKSCLADECEGVPQDCRRGGVASSRLTRQLHETYSACYERTGKVISKEHGRKLSPRVFSPFHVTQKRRCSIPRYNTL